MTQHMLTIVRNVIPCVLPFPCGSEVLVSQIVVCTLLEVLGPECPVHGEMKAFLSMPGRPIVKLAHYEVVFTSLREA